MPEPPPTPGRADVTESLIELLRERQTYGRQKYGQSLMTFDSRRNLSDLRDELLDALQYVHKEILEREALEAEIESLRKRVCPYHLPVNADDTHASCDLGVGEATEAGCPATE